MRGKKDMKIEEQIPLNITENIHKDNSSNDLNLNQKIENKGESTIQGNTNKRKENTTNGTENKEQVKETKKIENKDINIELYQNKKENISTNEKKEEKIIGIKTYGSEGLDKAIKLDLHKISPKINKNKKEVELEKIDLDKSKPEENKTKNIENNILDNNPIEDKMKEKTIINKDSFNNDILQNIKENNNVKDNIITISNNLDNKTMKPTDILTNNINMTTTSFPNKLEKEEIAIKEEEKANQPEKDNKTILNSKDSSKTIPKEKEEIKKMSEGSINTKEEVLNKFNEKEEKNFDNTAEFEGKKRYPNTNGERK